MKATIFDCPLTHEDSKVLKGWIDDSKSKEYKQNKGYHTGIDIVADNVYSICAGVCTYVGYSKEERNVVIIQYDRNLSFRYCNLDATDIQKGQQVSYQAEIGVAHKFVHFEAITTTSSRWCIRVGGRDYYKDDPTEYAFGNIDYSYSEGAENFVWNDVDASLQTEF